MKPEFSRQIFEKYSNIKFHENPSSWSRVAPCGLTDGHESNSRFSQFCERAYKLVELAAYVEDSEVDFEISSLYSEHPVSLSVT